MLIASCTRLALPKMQSLRTRQKHLLAPANGANWQKSSGQKAHHHIHLSRCLAVMLVAICICSCFISAPTRGDWNKSPWVKTRKIITMYSWLAREPKVRGKILVVKKARTQHRIDRGVIYQILTQVPLQSQGASRGRKQTFDKA